MAIFSLNHSFIGRSTHAPGSASLYARYIMRREVCTAVLGERMPTELSWAMQWLDAHENADRKNARVIDKVIVALPIELTHEQNAELLRAYCERMTQGRAAWTAAMHDGPTDSDNPHAHIIFRDRDFESGKRVMLTTERGSTQRFRDAWEEEANRALERAGHEQRIDKRTLAEQGIDREAQLHVGAAAEKMAQRSYNFESREQEVTRIINGEPTTVTVNYPAIDDGKTRFGENEERKQRNLEREQATLQQSRMDQLVATTQRLEDLYGNFIWYNETPPDDIYVLSAMLKEHIAERPARDNPPEPVRDEGWDLGSADPTGRPPRRDIVDAIGGAGMALIGKIAESIETIFDGPSKDHGEERDKPMADEEQQQRAQQHVRQQQQKYTAEELEKWRKIELQMMLNQRDRERHHDRGR